MLSRRRAERELADELSFHVEMEARKNVRAGLAEDAALTQARARFGSLAAIGDACRDVRRAQFIDTCVRDIGYALRSLRRTPTVAVTVVGTIALGLGLMATVFAVFNAFALRPVAVHEPHSLFSVELSMPGQPGPVPFVRSQYDALRVETSVFSDAVGILSGVSTRIDGRRTEGHLVTGNFFEVLGATPLLGRTFVSHDDVPEGASVMVLSHSGWLRLFNRAPDVVGKSIRVSGHWYEVVGVAHEQFKGLGLLTPDFWAPLARVGHFRPWFLGQERFAGIDVVGRLRPDVANGQAEAALAVWLTRVAAPTRATIRLEPRRTALPWSTAILLTFSPLFTAFGLVLLIGCANVTNLLLARAVLRQKEIGVRLSLGASRRRVVRQLFIESLVLGLAAAAAGLALSRLLLHVAGVVLARTIPPEFGEYVDLVIPAMAPTDWRVVLFVVVLAVFATTLFGLAPALQATRFDLIRVMRGEARRIGKPSRARNLLISSQVTATVLLLISAGVFLRAAIRSTTSDPGLRTADTIVVDVANEPFRASLVNAVKADSSVMEVAATWRHPLNQPRAGFAAPAEADVLLQGSGVAYRFVSPEYFPVFGVGVVKGRGFTQPEATSRAAVVVISESTASRIWPDANAVGQQLRLEADPESDTRTVGEPPLPASPLTVVGIVRDVAGFRMTGYGEAGVYLPTTTEMAGTALVARVREDPDTARRNLLELLTAIDPHMGAITTMRTVERMDSYPMQIGFSLTVVLGGLALLMTSTGILSVLSYLVAQRTREIGVRVALGATTRNIVSLVLSQSLQFVATGALAGTALAWLLSSLIMSTPAGERIRAFADVHDPAVYVASVACIAGGGLFAAALPARKAARVDPATTLRRD